MTGATCCPSKLHSESLSLRGGQQLTSQTLSDRLYISCTGDSRVLCGDHVTEASHLVMSDSHYLG